MNKKINEELLSDKRFKIDSYALNNHLQISKIISYEIVNIPVGSILRQKNNRIFNIKYSDPSMYLQTKNIDEYNKYCKHLTVKGDKEHHNIEIFNELIKSIDKEDYDISKGIIVINQLNIIMDGQHRAAIILNKYGEDFVIPVLRIKYSRLGIRTLFNYLRYKIKKQVFR